MQALFRADPRYAHDRHGPAAGTPESFRRACKRLEREAARNGTLRDHSALSRLVDDMRRGRWPSAFERARAIAEHGGIVGLRLPGEPPEPEDPTC